MRWRVELLLLAAAIGGAGACSFITDTSALSGGLLVDTDGGDDGSGIPTFDAGDAALTDGRVADARVDATTCASGSCSCTDSDGDGVFACGPDGKTVLDCNDKNAAVHPGAKEVCDKLDNDCDGLVDNVPAVLSESLVPPLGPHWIAAGSAVATDAGLGIELTGDVQSQAGAVWWGAEYTFDAFDVTATFSIEDITPGADGCGFGWVPGLAYGSTGGGTGYGLTGLNGYFVAIDTYQSGTEPAAPYLLLSGPSMGYATAGLPRIRDGQPHELRVKLDSGKVSAWVDSFQYFNEVELPGYVPFNGRWGFAGGTGSFFERHYVSKMTMTFPNGQGCTP